MTLLFQGARARRPRRLATAWAAAFALVAACSSLSFLEDFFKDPEYDGRTRDGRQEGPWTYYYLDASGERAVLPSGAPAIRASGNYSEDKQYGRWIYYFPNGNVQWEVNFANEAFNGPTQFFYENGATYATGAFEGGLPQGPWVFRDRQGNEVQVGAYEAGEPSGRWTFRDERGQIVAEGTRQGDEFVGVWRFYTEDDQEYPVDFERSSGSEQPEFLRNLIDKLSSRASIPVQSQPRITRLEDELSDYLVQIFTVGRENVPPPESKLAVQTGYGSTKLGKRKFNNKKKASELQGKQLPWRFLFDVNERQLNLLEPAQRGKKSVIVILRGQTDEVCIYCMSQTEGLANKKFEFERRGAEITLVYPGQSDNLDAFLSLYLREFGGDDPEFTWAYDEGFKFVDQLNIRADFAMPTTLILDEKGLIRWAYVGLAIDDRPSTAKILEALDSIAGDS